MFHSNTGSNTHACDDFQNKCDNIQNKAISLSNIIINNLRNITKILHKRLYTNYNKIITVLTFLPMK